MSRQKSGRGTKPARGKAAAPARGAGRVMVAKPKSDVWVALLGVSLGAIILGALLLVLVLNKYEFAPKVS